MLADNALAEVWKKTKKTKKTKEKQVPRTDCGSQPPLANVFARIPFLRTKSRGGEGGNEALVLYVHMLVSITHNKKKQLPQEDG